MFMHKYPELDELDFRILVLLKQHRKSGLAEHEIINYFVNYDNYEPKDIQHCLKMLTSSLSETGETGSFGHKATEPKTEPYLLKDNSLLKVGKVVYKITPKGSVAAADYLHRKKELYDEEMKLYKEKRSDYRWRAAAVFTSVLATIFAAIAIWRDEVFQFFRFIRYMFD